MTAWSIAIKTVGNTTHNNDNLRHRSKSEGAADSTNSQSNTQSCTAGNSTNSTTTTNQSPITSNDTSTSNFIIKVNPDDPIYTLHKQIELVTGLKANQQRLIYRGRIINCQSKNNSTSARSAVRSTQVAQDTNSDSQNDIEANLGDALNDQFPTYTTTTSQINTNNTLRVRDVNGLCDQQTIHLVPRPTIRNTPNSTANTTNASSEVGTEVSLNSMLNTIPTHHNTANNSNSNSDVETMLSNITALQNGAATNGGNTTSLTGEAGMSLLAALLGVGANNNNNSTSNSNGATANSGRGGTTENTNTNQQQQPNSVNGNTTGLGSVINQAVRMGVLDVEEENETLSGSGASNVRIMRPGANNNGGQIVGIPGLASTNPTTQTAATNQSETFPRLAPLGNTARRTMRNNRNPNTPRNTNGNSTSAATSARVATARAARERRESLARLTEDDIRITNLGSVEPIRQGLLTLHTLLGNALLIDDDQNQEQQIQEQEVSVIDDSLIPTPSQQTSSLPSSAIRPSSSIRAPLDSYRRWYRGQWLDVLDTVNQWLEATIVDIVLPCDILSSGYRFNNNTIGRNRQRRTRRRRRTPDAVVSANDLEGRRRLLLEPIPDTEEEEDEYESEVTSISHLIDEGYRPRSDNTNIQLLLVHYNGWPHRWDEWIRSDSERIRPFRTRTRHLQGTNGRNLNNNVPGSGSNPSRRVLHSPTPQATFNASPSTIIRSEEDDVDERSGMIVELGRVLGSVNELYHAATSSTSVAASRMPQSIGEGLMNSNAPSSSSRNDLGETTPSSTALHLPWQTLSNRNTVEWQRVPPSTSQRSYRDAIANLLGDEEEDDNGEETPSASTLLQDPRDQFDAAQLRQLAPLIDRLGRTLTDAAPHVAALADSLSATSIVRASAALDAATEAATSTINEAINSSGVAVQEEDAVEDHIQMLTAQASHLYFGIGDNEEDADNAPMPASVDDMMATSLLPDSTSAAFSALSASIDRVVQEGEQAVAMAEQVLEENGHVIEENTVPIIDPNLTDYINGMVNTTRGSVPGERGRGIRDNGDPVGSSLLASYLSSMGGIGADAVDNANGATNGNDGTRVIRMGGGRTGGVGPGIDIHIHAVVTGAGEGLAGLGGLSTGGGGVAATTNTNATPPFVNNPPFGSTTNHDSDHDLFSELYSESPIPVDPHGDEATDITGIHNYNHGNDLGELFEECRSIEEEDSDDDEEEAIDSDGSSILALSEIDSQEATSPPRVSMSQGSPQRSIASSTIVADDRTPVSSPSSRIALRSLSLRSRLFRNTLGRLPRSSRRSSSNR